MWAGPYIKVYTGVLPPAGTFGRISAESISVRCFQANFCQQLLLLFPTGEKLHESIEKLWRRELLASRRIGRLICKTSDTPPPSHPQNPSPIFCHCFPSQIILHHLMNVSRSPSYRKFTINSLEFESVRRREFPHFCSLKNTTWTRSRLSFNVRTFELFVKKYVYKAKRDRVRQSRWCKGLVYKDCGTAAPQPN